MATFVIHKHPVTISVTDLTTPYNLTDDRLILKDLNIILNYYFVSHLVLLGKKSVIFMFTTQHSAQLFNQLDLDYH